MGAHTGRSGMTWVWRGDDGSVATTGLAGREAVR